MKKKRGTGQGRKERKIKKEEEKEKERRHRNVWQNVRCNIEKADMMSQKKRMRNGKENKKT